MEAVNPAASWHTEHVFFSRLLDLLQREVEVLACGERPNYRLMIDVVEYLRVYSDRYHHAREDAAFGILGSGNPLLRPRLERFRREHRRIAQAGDALLRSLSEVVEDRVREKSGIEATAVHYIGTSRDHIAGEEKDIVGLALATLTAEQWRSVAQAAPGGFDAMFGAQPEVRYRQLLGRVTP